MLACSSAFVDADEVDGVGMVVTRRLAVSPGGEETRDVVREFSKDGNVYKILDGFFIDGRHFFQFDKQATEERKRDKPDGPPMVECPRCHHRFVQKLSGVLAGDAARLKADRDAP